MAESAYTVFQRDSVSSFEDSRIEAERYYPGSFSDELFDQKTVNNITKQLDITKQIDSQKKDESADLSHIKTPQEKQVKTPRQKILVSLLQQSLFKRTQSNKEQITIYFFNSEKRMAFQKQEVHKHFNRRSCILIKELIPYIVKSYCRLILNFEPMQIAQQSFQLKLANFENHDDANIDPLSHQLDISFLFESDNLVLVRKQRNTDKLNDWTQQFEDKAEIQVFQILMPQKKQFTMKIEKNKTVNVLKEKIASFNNQLAKFVVVSYYNFRLCQNKKKISDLDEKIFEVYRQRVDDFVDRPIVKNSVNYSYGNGSYYYEQLWKNRTGGQEENPVAIEYFVNQTPFFGKLMLSLVKSQIIEKYSGGIMATFPFASMVSLLSNGQEERTKKYSIHTLIGIKNTMSEDLILRFMYKDRYVTKHYRFQYLDKKQKFFKNLLKMGRIYNKKWDRIQ